MRSWKRRWAVVKANKMYFYAEKGAKDPAEFIRLNECRVERADRMTKKPNSFAIIHNNATLQPTCFLIAPTEDICQEWIDFLQRKTKNLS
jgi:hypothetical protein